MEIRKMYLTIKNFYWMILMFAEDKKLLKS